MFIVVCGVSGAGKSTLLRNLNHSSLELPRSVTTRKPRVGESKREYLFVYPSMFEQLKSENKLLIYQWYHQDQYGILTDDYEAIIKKGKIAIKDIGYDGILMLKSQIKQVPCILIDAPLDALVERMKKRGDSDEQIKERLIFVREELNLYESIADYKVSNGSNIASCEQNFQKILKKIIKTNLPIL